MRTPAADLGQRRVAVARGAGRKSLVLEDTGHEIADIGFVIDNQNVTGHGLHLSCQLPVAASIFVSMCVGSGGVLVSAAAIFVSGPCGLASSALSFLACPVTAKRSRIQAPRWPSRKSEASFNSIRPPWSSSTRPTIASPGP